MSDYAILKNGEPVAATLFEWAAWLEEDDDNRRVALTMVGDVKISTVFLGMDHGFGGKPLWFETMVFGGVLGEEMERYETLEEAMRGHERMVARVRNDINDRL